MRSQASSRILTCRSKYNQQADTRGGQAGPRAPDHDSPEARAMSETTVTSRTIHGVELPAAGTYAIDESHTHVGFAVRHMAVSKVRGQFAKVDGTLVVGEDPTQSSIQVTIDTNSVDTRDETRDNHVRTADFLDVENHPTITFNSTAVHPVD